MLDRLKVRVIAGELRGRSLLSPRGVRIRPTSDSLRETLFNVLGCSIENARVLDACAGTGALGIEALSRGAAQVVFVDQDYQALQVIAKNVTGCGVETQSVIVLGALPEAANRPELSDSFDLIMVDPPYDDQQIGAILSSVADRLRSEGVLVLERSKRTPTCEAPGLTCVRTVKAGDSALDFYRCSK